MISIKLHNKFSKPEEAKIWIFEVF